MSKIVRLKIDNFAVFKIDICWGCEKKNQEVHAWDQYNPKIWLCLSCWKELLTNLVINKEEWKKDKNNSNYVYIEVDIKNHPEWNSKSIILISVIERKLKQTNHFLGRKNENKRWSN